MSGHTHYLPLNLTGHEPQEIRLHCILTSAPIPMAAKTCLCWSNVSGVIYRVNDEKVVETLPNKGIGGEKQG